MLYLIKIEGPLKINYSRVLLKPLIKPTVRFASMTVEITGFSKLNVNTVEEKLE